MKHKERFIRDVKFYLHNRHIFTFTGSSYLQFQHDSNGVDGLVAYRKWDSEGKIVSTRHPILAETLVRVKASVNLQIKEWKSGIRDANKLDFLIVNPHEMRLYLDGINAPEWVWKSIKPFYERYFTNTIEGVRQ